MKSFKEYLTESKKVYEFKVKIAGDVENASETIKSALSMYKVESCSAGKRTPIQESPVDFPEHNNVNVTMYDVTTAYPANSAQVRAAIAQALKITETCVKVRTPAEEAECELNHQHDEKSGEALLEKDYPAENNQNMVGNNRTMELLKELSKVRHELEQYKGVNDQILAAKVPSEKAEGPAVKEAKQQNKSPVGSSTVKKPTAKTVGVK